MSRSHLPRNLVMGSFFAAALFAFAGRALSATAAPDTQAAPATAKAPAPASKAKAGPAMGKVTSKPEAAKRAEAPAPVEKPVAEGKAGAAAPVPHAAKKADAPAGPAGGEKSQAPTAGEALAWLEEGNARWVSNSSQNPNISSERRGEVAGGSR